MMTEPLATWQLPVAQENKVHWNRHQCRCCLLRTDDLHLWFLYTPAIQVNCVDCEDTRGLLSLIAVEWSKTAKEEIQ